MFLTKIPCLLKNTLPGVVQCESQHANVLVRKFLRDNTFLKFSTSIQQNEQQQDSTREQLSSLSTNTGTLDKLYKKIEIEVRGNDPAVLKSYGKFAMMAANYLNINVCRK
ncbi:28s ribosomal protein mitochondrial-like protein [Lasius niger]|uniref:28s ribosomal protein mitochondrial-like protein n=1 Tax=Lasius niger TaxID=67767 RepID=A0A0J7NQW9_LASNI|nr:28s ribosomal protein mitochondrial-like protein [Lasius niger]